MRAKRSKKYRKIMSNYAMTFAFREPYQVLLDSSFLRTCHSFHMPLQKYLENTLHGECRLFVTRCSLAKIMADFEREREREQRQRTKDKDKDPNRDPKDPPQRQARWQPKRPEWLPPPTEVPLRHCKHKNDDGEDVGELDEARCLLDLLAGQPHGNEIPRNKQHYILATADPVDEHEMRRKGFIDVRERARMISGVPIVYVKRSVMILEELSGASEAVKRKGEKDKFAEGLVGLNRKRKRGEGPEDDEHEGDLLALTQELEDENGNNAGVKARATKRAKGPNPLSVRKKKTVQPAQGGKQEDKEGEGEGEGEGQARKRRRKRSGKKAEPDAGEGAVAVNVVPEP
ncbi:hypothetical protein LTR99_004803 [Exophiala xenobiotica]|uniref:UTP23 sensor motif region domain-containing protein n=1 Tax=Vermiconidia calcicola TaxID=1690605 RepID=A0AAV9QEH5_9PEZI|nr:hypothetical protein H2202_008860 [Exophiala xenobiotica]KAK5540084.1 hypothetical protein LTR25_003789 [Vermiconidia calcicola]KAK5543174.1 hypothetical protein LTR23_004937 [Chaetothyriales sp. CCFEE 6169]KAK5200015.1 hypothetical protein LTR92_000556 [Exophiala xenobiotica]KAK5213925.1 hypothetical protein LTR41_000117 [Exophiala xenobiotica]